MSETSIATDTEIARRLAFVRFDADARDALNEVKSAIDAALPSAMDSFYNHIGQFEEARQFFGAGSQKIQAASGRQVKH
jgi:methyl-accepting chemotaxis protein